jgi:3-deoxy-D-manno-octulosonate 8-phosphate phosphatase (KDO 8-P phosphatase)
LDSDGVLTDGKIIYSAERIETRHFHARDGLGIKLLQCSDIKIAVISGKKTRTLTRRCTELGIKNLYQNIKNKVATTEKLLNKLNLNFENVAYMGDDWNDYPVIQKVGFSGIPADGAEEMKPNVDFVSDFAGGNGAVRQFIEHILKEKGIYEETLEALLHVIQNSDN